MINKAHLAIRILSASVFAMERCPSINITTNCCFTEHEGLACFVPYILFGPSVYGNNIKYWAWALYVMALLMGISVITLKTNIFKCRVIDFGNRNKVKIWDLHRSMIVQKYEWRQRLKVWNLKTLTYAANCLNCKSR